MKEWPARRRRGPWRPAGYPDSRSVDNAGVTSDMGRPRWWSTLRGFAFFLTGAGLGACAYLTLTHRPGGVPWAGILFGALVCATLSALLPRRRRR